MCHRELLEKSDLRLTLDDAMPHSIRGNLVCDNPERLYDVQLTSRRLGQDTGRDILLDIGGQIEIVRRTLYEVNLPASTGWDKAVKAKASKWT